MSRFNCWSCVPLRAESLSSSVSVSTKNVCHNEKYRCQNKSFRWNLGGLYNDFDEKHEKQEVKKLFPLLEHYFFRYLGVKKVATACPRCSNLEHTKATRPYIFHFPCVSEKKKNAPPSIAAAWFSHTWHMCPCTRTSHSHQSNESRCRVCPH